MRAIIIGGGNAARTLINYFLKTTSLKIEAVVDPNNDAPGMKYAREHDIPTGSDQEKYIGDSSVDIIVELTGNSNVRESVLAMKQPHQEIMTAGAARMLCQTLEDRQKDNAENAIQISDDFINLTKQMNAIIDNIDSSIRDVRQINKSLHMTSLNATVEAARLGQDGKSFAVITDEMKNLSDSINEVLSGIQDAAGQMKTVIEDITKAERRLKEVFSDGAQ